LEKRGQGRRVKRIPPQHLFENSKIEMQKPKLENELTESKTKLENVILKSTFEKSRE